jgi:hypothetical protein
LKTAFDENRPTFLEILARDLCKARPKDDINKRDLFALLAALEAVLAIDRRPSRSTALPFGV